jgi:hypothetical protein
LTILNSREFSDHHFLFHVALIPFTLGDLRIGAKWAAVLFSSLAFLSVWWLLYAQEVPFAALWALSLLAVSEAFLYRMSITRAQSLSLAVLALGLHWLLTGKYKRLIPLAFLYVWLYDAFPLLLAVAACYVLGVWLAERRLDLRPVIYVGWGLALGLIINPYFPHNIIFFIRHLAPKLTETTAVSVGSEWYPYTTAQLLQNSPLTWVALFAGVVALGLNTKRMDSRTSTSLFILILMSLLLFQARRFIEYFPAFAVIFAAFSWTPLLQREGFTMGSLSLQIGQSTFGKYVKHTKLLWKWIFTGLFLLILLPGMWNTVRAAESSLKDSLPYTLYASASRWLMDNTPPGSRVFQTDWDDFPRLFFYNTQNTYLVGLDPTYMQIYDPQLYDLWVKITRGNIDQPSRYIYPQFGANYILSDLLHTDFIQKASQDSGLKEIYRDQDAVIYQVLITN